MSGILPGAPGPITAWLAFGIADVIIWVEKRLGVYKEPKPDPEKEKQFREMMEAKGFHFKE